MAIHLVVLDFMVPTLDSVYQVVLFNSKVAMHVANVLVQISISSFNAFKSYRMDNSPHHCGVHHS